MKKCAQINIIDNLLYTYKLTEIFIIIIIYLRWNMANQGQRNAEPQEHGLRSTISRACVPHTCQLIFALITRLHLSLCLFRILTLAYRELTGLCQLTTAQTVAITT